MPSRLPHSQHVLVHIDKSSIHTHEVFNAPRFPIAHLDRKAIFRNIQHWHKLGLTQLATTRYDEKNISVMLILRQSRTDVILFEPGSVTEAKDAY